LSAEAAAEAVEVTVRAIAAGGAGVADLPDGRVAFVHRTAPGDRARVRVTAAKPTWARAALVELIAPGPERRQPPCPFYARCGGCTLEHLEYAAQLVWKGRIVADALSRIGRTPVDPPRVEASARELRYRNRVTFTLRRFKGGRVIAGFHELEDPDRLVDLSGACLLPEQAIALVWDRLRAAWGEGAERLPDGARLRLTLRSVANGVVLLVDGGSGSWTPDVLLRDVQGLVAIWHQESGAKTPVLMAGDPRAHEIWLGEPVRPGARAFLQVNREAAERLHAAVLDAVGPARGLTVVDGYCGVGVYGRALARSGSVVTGIELDPEAAAAARDRSPEGFRLLEGTVEARLREALPADLVIVNPPRTGLHEAVPRLLGEHPVARVLYVSCDPATLARDLTRLDGYRLAELRSFDLFPQTAHVETLAVLARG
jgi:23S rRNA (uracil1939-C5)-methyltransferase